MKKQLNTLTLSGLMIGPILGSGIILLPPIVYDLTGNLSILVWFVILALGFAFALVLGNLSIKFPGDEGVTNAVQAAFSTKLKYLTSYYLISAVLFGPVPVYLIGAHFIQPLIGLDVNTLAFSMLFFTFLALLRPVHFLGTLSLIVTTIIGIILSLGSIAILIGHETHVSFDSPFDIGLISKALLLAFWAIVGWEVVGNYSKEVRNPEQTIPKAVKISAVVISIIYLLVICAIQFASLKHTNAITALIYPLFGTSSEFVIGILAMLLCLSTVLLFVGGVARLISGLTSQNKGIIGLLSTRLQNGSPIGATLFLCTVNAVVLGLVSVNVFTLKDLVALADGFFIANATIALLAAYKLATTKTIRYTALLLSIVFGCMLLSAHWIVLSIIALLAWKVLR
jgi:APA family basic amino acid/polyamine antiporter